jgi:hypothetical protein
MQHASSCLRPLKETLNEEEYLLILFKLLDFNNSFSSPRDGYQ